jgi:tetratricopeptide (TPR) repeat protein
VGSWRRPVAEKLPLLLMAIGVACVTFVGQEAAGSVRTVEGLPTTARLANAMIALVAYLGRTVWPTDLAIFYPHPFLLSAGAWTTSFVVGGGAATVLLAAITWCAVRWRRSHPYLLVGWLLYVGMLLPVLGLVQVGAQARADRYSYLPLVGVFLAGVMGFASLLDRWNVPNRRRWFGGAAIVGVLTVVGAVQVARWRDDLTLFGHAVVAVSDNYLAHNHLGLGLHRRGRIDEAAAEFDRAIAIRPDYAWAMNNRAACCLARGDYAQAEQHLRRALALTPGFADAWNNLGNAQFFLRRFADAAASYENAMRTARSERSDYRLNLALVCEKLGRWDQALGLYAGVLRAEPGNVHAASRTGLVLAAQGQLAAAQDLFESMLRNAPELPQALHGLGVVAARRGDAAQAENLLSRALVRNPRLGEAHRAIAGLLASRGDHADAISHFESCLAIDGGDADVHNDAAVEYAQQAQPERVMHHLQEALRIQPDHELAKANLRAVQAGGRASRTTRGR